MRRVGATWTAPCVLLLLAACSRDASIARVDAGSVPGDGGGEVDAGSAPADGGEEIVACGQAKPSESPPLGCEPADVEGDGRSCRCILGYFWGGTDCVALLTGCACTKNCDRLYRDKESCVLVYAHCFRSGGDDQLEVGPEAPDDTREALESALPDLQPDTAMSCDLITQDCAPSYGCYPTGAAARPPASSRGSRRRAA